MKDFMKQLKIAWRDSRSEDCWTPVDSIEPQSALIVTLGHLVKETDEVLCIASSVDMLSGQVCGVMHIPKICIESRVRIRSKKA